MILLSVNAILTQFANPDTRHWSFSHLVRKYQVKAYAHIKKMVINSTFFLI